MKRRPSAAGRGPIAFGTPALVEHVQVAHERLEPPPVASRADHRVGLDPRAIGEHDPARVERFDCGDHLDPAGL